MANTPVRGADCVPYGHVRGQVGLATAVSPRMKDELIDLAEAQGITLKALLVDALAAYIAEYNRRAA